jgi:maltose alpha-D-glucosyltransferase/alpha-amylase
VEVLHAGYPFVYVRGGRYLVVVNPQQGQASHPLGGIRPGRALEASGVETDGGTVTAQGFGYGIFEVDG